MNLNSDYSQNMIHEHQLISASINKLFMPVRLNSKGFDAKKSVQFLLLL